MKKLVLFGLLLSVSPLLFAETPPPPLNIVSFQIQNQQWVTSNTAKVYVSVSATTNAAGLSDIHSQITKKLEKLSSIAQWRITSFSRSQYQSGLEQVNARAEVRLPESALAKIRESAKNLRKPGFTIKLVNISFTPSQANMQQAQSLLRAKVYQKINTELTNLNKAFPSQHYVVHKINFNLATSSPKNRMIAFAAAEKSNARVPAMQVSQRVYAIAKVDFSSSQDS